MVLYGAIWSSMVPSDLLWSYMVLYSLLWSYIVLSGSHA